MLSSTVLLVNILQMDLLFPLIFLYLQKQRKLKEYLQKKKDCLSYAFLNSSVQPLKLFKRTEPNTKISKMAQKLVMIPGFNAGKC